MIIKKMLNSRTGKIMCFGFCGLTGCISANNALANAVDMGLYTVTNITDNTDLHDKNSNINRESAIVWQGEDPTPGQDDYEIFMYTPSTGLQQITNNDLDDQLPEINKNGVIVWQAAHMSMVNNYKTIDGNYNIWTYNTATGTISQITNNDIDDKSPHISDNGNMVWNTGHGNEREIVYYHADSGETTQITTNDFDDYIGFSNFKMNAYGQILWMGKNDEIDADGNSVIGADWEIWSYNPASGEISRLTDNQTDNWDPQINDNGVMVWEENDGNDYELIYQASSDVAPIRLTDNAFDDWYPKLNNKGDVAWMSHDGNDWEIARYFADTGETVMLTDNDWDDLSHSINNRGDVVWVAFNKLDSAKPLSLQLYDDTIGTSYEITTFMGHFFTPKINEQAQITWTASESKGWEIFYAAPNPIPADITFRPGHINLRSKRDKIKAIIELPEMFYSEDIDARTIKIKEINGVALRKPIDLEGRVRVGDFNKNGITDLKIHFETDDLLKSLQRGTAELLITGELTDGTPFSGSGFLQIRDKKIKKHHKRHKKHQNRHKRNRDDD